MCELERQRKSTETKFVIHLNVWNYCAISINRISYQFRNCCFGPPWNYMTFKWSSFAVQHARSLLFKLICPESCVCRGKQTSSQRHKCAIDRRHYMQTNQLIDCRIQLTKPDYFDYFLFSHSIKFQSNAIAKWRQHRRHAQNRNTRKKKSHDSPKNKRHIFFYVRS